MRATWLCFFFRLLSLIFAALGVWVVILLVRAIRSDAQTLSIMGLCLQAVTCAWGTIWPWRIGGQVARRETLLECERHAVQKAKSP